MSPDGSKTNKATFNSINRSMDHSSVKIAFGTRVREDYNTSPSRKIDLNKILQNASFSVNKFNDRSMSISKSNEKYN